MITRRIFRSGESEYLINKTPVRLKDILEIFMGTGIGAEAYSLVEQGKIDLILSSRPEDRRLVFDEASGITKYKSQKKEALRRLEDTEDNLLRINDIIQEVKRQIGSLERQANKARRYKEIFEELKSKELQIAQYKLKNIKDEKTKLLKEKQDLENALQEKERAIGLFEKDLLTASEELKNKQAQVSEINNRILNLENSIQRNIEHVQLNEERQLELQARKKLLQESIQKLKERLIIDQEKFAIFQKEYSGLEAAAEAKFCQLQEKEKALEKLMCSLKEAQALIEQAKEKILTLASQEARLKNELADLNAILQTKLNQKRRLEIDLAKIREEKTQIEEELNAITSQLKDLQAQSADLKDALDSLRIEKEQADQRFLAIEKKIKELADLKLALHSQKEFIEKLILKYQDISEAMDAAVMIDREPKEKITGLIVKIKDAYNLSPEEKNIFASAKYKLSGEAKSIDLDAQAISAKIQDIEKEVALAINQRSIEETTLQELNQKISQKEQEEQKLRMRISNYSTQKDIVTQKLNKVLEEEKIIALELSEVETELNANEAHKQKLLKEQEKIEEDQQAQEELLSRQQELSAENTKEREKLLVLIAQIGAEAQALKRRKDQDLSTLKTLEETFLKNKEDLARQETELKENEERAYQIASEIENLEKENQENSQEKEKQKILLKELKLVLVRLEEELKKKNSDLQNERIALDQTKTKLYEHNIAQQELDFKASSLKERILEVYKIEDLEKDLESVELKQDMRLLEEETAGLKEKLDACGTVNLVAIEEYEELKKRYDFLTQQQNDLVSAKKSLEEAISKINRTTKELFLETFNKVCEEFKNYFRLLFGGGDAKLFLVDEQDPLESGIEIIARPPGKKLQNVLLLSGGEKSLAAVALLFAIFKVKPTSFSVLDEVDAALDEANIDRFGRMVHDFTSTTQFILITHNKKTIAHADVMYGITMQNTGISKIVSVKFSQHSAKKTPPKEDKISEPV